MSGDRTSYIRETKLGINPGSCMMVPTRAYGKSNIAIGHFGFDINPCNAHLADLAARVKEGFIESSYLHPNIFSVTGVSDGISMGYDAMRHSLVSRDLAALSIINHVSAAPYEGIILVPGCDKNMPASAMALLSLNIPGLILSGGSIKPGTLNGKDIDIVNVFVADGEVSRGLISQDQRYKILAAACPGFGACGGMYTANSMFTLFESMGFSPLGSSSNLAESVEKYIECNEAHKILEDMIANNRTPSEYITKASFENAARMVSVLGGSSNPILHLKAMARAAKIDFKEKDFERISSQTPFIGNLMPSGENRMKDISESGGTPAILRYMLESGHLNGDALTLTGRPIGEELSRIEYDKDKLLKSGVIKSFDEPYLPRGHLVMVNGNLGTGWTKISGSGLKPYEGRAVVFDSEADFHAHWEEKVKGDGDFVVIRYEGPKAAPGMPEMLKPTTALVGKFGKEARIGMLTPGRFSGGSVGGAPIIGHVDEEMDGGLVALVCDGDMISVDPSRNSMNLLVETEEIDRRRKDYRIPIKVLERIAESPEDLKMYNNLTSSAREGATMLFN